MKKLILSIILAGLTFNVQAKEIEVEALGVGPDYEWAVMNAIDNAVKQTSDVYVGREAPLQRMELKSKESLSGFSNERLDINDGTLLSGKKSVSYSGDGKGVYESETAAELKEINAKYEGKISSYSVISSEEKDGRFYVKIKAVVKKADDYKSPDLIKKAKYSLLVLPFQAEAQVSCLNKKESSAPLVEKLMSVLVEKISKSKKFSVLDRENAEIYMGEAFLIAAELTKEESKSHLQNIVSADYMLVGKIEAFNTSKTTQNVPMTGESYSNSSASIQVSYKLIEVATMEVITSSVVEEKIKRSGSFSSCANVEQELAKKVGNKITTEMLTEIFPDYKAPQEPKKAEKKKVKAAKPAKPEPIKLPFD